MKSLNIAALVALILFWFPLFAQNNRVDSLLSIYEKSAEDTSRVIVLLALSGENLSTDPDEALRYAGEAGDLARKLRYGAGVALAYKNIGIAYKNKGMYIEALQQYEQSLDAYKAIEDKKGMAAMLKNTGSIYGHQGNDEKALAYYIQALKVSEEIGDTLQWLSSLSNIGTINMYKPAMHPQAFRYLWQAHKLSTRIDDDYTRGTVAVNLGELHLYQDRFDSAMMYFNESLKAFEGTADVAYTLNNIGALYRKQRRFDDAVATQQRAIDIAEKFESLDNIQVSLLGIAQSYAERGNDEQALVYYQRAEEFSKRIDAKYALVDVYYGLAKTYAGLNDFDNAYRYQALLTTIKDTIYNLDTDKKLGTLQFTYDLEKKGAEIDLLTKDGELKAKELATQRMVRNGFIGGFAVVLLFAGVFLLQRNKISHEKKRSEALLLNILPEETAHELKQYGKTKARRYDSVTVLFTDFKGFSTLAETMTPEDLVEVIDHYFRAFDKIIKPFGIEKIKTIGDSYMAACGLPTADPDHATKMIQAALAIREFVAKDAIRRDKEGLIYFDIRIGVHSGPVVAGIVGESKFAYDIWGDTVNMASRMESSGVPGKVNISGETYKLIKDKFNCVHRGKVNVKHKDDVEMYFVEQEAPVAVEAVEAIAVS